MAQEEQSKASRIENFTAEGEAPVKLRPINEVGDEHQKARSLKSMAVLAALIFVLWYLGTSLENCMGGKSQPAVSAASITNGTMAPSVTPLPVHVGGDLLGGMMQTPGAFDYGQSAASTMAKGPDVTPAPLTVRCYSLYDVGSVYSDTVVYKGGLFFAEKYTRVKGGMIFNRTFGWYYSVNFGCAPGLDALEVEFVEPKASPTRLVSAVRSSVVSQPVGVVSSPTVVILPTATPASGIVSFSALNCDYVTWLAWNVKAVYLQVGSDHRGVPGDNGGQPVVTSVCPYTGTLTLQAIGQDGLTYSRMQEVQ